MDTSSDTEREPDLTIAELCRLTGTSRPTIARRIADGTIPSYRIGAAVRIPREALDALRTTGAE